MTSEVDTSKKTRLELLAPALPTALWVVLVVVVLVILHEPVNLLLGRAKTVKVGDIVEIDTRFTGSTRLLPDALQPDSADPMMRSLARRWQSLSLPTRPYRILVAHDEYPEAKPIQAALTELGIEADIGLCPPDIETLLRRHNYDVVISDVRWDACPQSGYLKDGIKFLAYSVENRFNRPTVFFVRNYKPELGIPAYATGITNNWYEVLHYVLDVLSRQDKPASQETG
jgi:hypothetical protein